MSITAIARDFNNLPNIVRIIASDTLAQVATADYVTAQQSNINDLNSEEKNFKAQNSMTQNGSNEIVSKEKIIESKEAIEIIDPSLVRERPINEENYEKLKISYFSNI